jgi:hypothetical protein
VLAFRLQFHSTVHGDVPRPPSGPESTPVQGTYHILGLFHYLTSTSSLGGNTRFASGASGGIPFADTAVNLLTMWWHEKLARSAVGVK